MKVGRWVKSRHPEGGWRAIVGKRNGRTRCGTLCASRCHHSGQEINMHRRQVCLQLAWIGVMPRRAQAQTASSTGEVLKIDKAAERITLKHNGVKNLDLPPMSLVFRVRELQRLDGLNPGDRVRFTAERIDGQFTVTSLSKVP
jgi:Cu(I)/Ag(I) efflux system periplasmic protein CusF